LIRKNCELTPQLSLIYDPDVPKEEALWLDLREAPELSVVKTLRPVELDVAVRAYLDSRTRVSYFTRIVFRAARKIEASRKGCG